MIGDELLQEEHRLLVRRLGEVEAEVARLRIENASLQEDKRMIDWMERTAREIAIDYKRWGINSGDYAWSMPHFGCPTFSIRDEDTFCFYTLRDAIRKGMVADAERNCS